MHSTIPCGYRFANMYTLSIIVIDKPIGLGGTISTYKSVFMSYTGTIYHQNKRFETYKSYKICVESSLQHSESQSHSFKKVDICYEWAYIEIGYPFYSSPLKVIK